MNEHNQHTSSSTAVVAVFVVLALVAALLVGCAVVGLLYFKTSHREALMVREMAMRAQVEAQKAQEIAERERQRAEENACEAARQAKLAAEQIANKETTAAPVTRAADSDPAEFQIEFDAEGRMSVAGETLDWEQVGQRLRELDDKSSAHVLIVADKQCRMEPVLRLLRIAGEIGIGATIRASSPEAKQTN